MAEENQDGNNSSIVTEAGSHQAPAHSHPHTRHHAWSRVNDPPNCRVVPDQPFVADTATFSDDDDTTQSDGDPTL